MLKPCVCFSMVYLKSSIGFDLNVSKYILINIKLYIVRLECFGEDISTCIKFIPYKGQWLRAQVLGLRFRTIEL